MTQNGGYAAFESVDGKLVYYYKGGSRDGVWQVPVEGGEEIQIIESIRGWAAFSVVDKGIYFISADGVKVRFLDFDTGGIQTVAEFEVPHSVLTVSPDGRTMLYRQTDSAGSDLMLVENFR